MSGESVTMRIGATYEVLDVDHPCNLWRGKLISAAVNENYCRLDFGYNVSGVFEFADSRLSLVEYPEVEEE